MRQFACKDLSLQVCFHDNKKASRRTLFLWLHKGFVQNGDQPPFFERLPGFFLLRVATPRSRLTRWPRPPVRNTVPGKGLGAGVR